MTQLYETYNGRNAIRKKTGGIMKGFLSSLMNFFVDRQYTGKVNLSFLVIIVVVLLIALWICIAISKKNKLYINYKKEDKDNAYT